jgi:hypothetical protein
MAPYHSKRLVISRDALLGIAEARALEAQDLIVRKRFSGAIFLGGCALECFLKAAVCTTLKLDGLPEVFKTHDLEALLLYSGLRSDLEARPAVQESFARIVEAWGYDGRDKLLYAEPGAFSKERAKRFMDHLTGKETGVIPWLQSRTSKRLGNE